LFEGCTCELRVHPARAFEVFSFFEFESRRYSSWCGTFAEIVAPWAWVTSLEEVNKVVNLLADLLKRPKEKRFKIQNDLSSRIISTYSWAICAKKTAQIYQKALGSTF
jgi:glycosyltransferase involved in cell wall biosynthesis